MTLAEGTMCRRHSCLIDRTNLSVRVPRDRERADRTIVNAKIGAS
jgi:hypothetical protein